MFIRVLNIPMYDRGLDSAVSECIQLCQSARPDKGRLVSATGAHGLVMAKDDQDFASVLNSFFWNLPDGTPSVWIGKLKGAKSMTRCYGPDFFARIMRQSAQTAIRHYLCGGKEGVAEELKTAVQLKFGNMNIVGTFCPPFREMSGQEIAELGRDIAKTRADIVWVGLSTPKQELFAHRLKSYCSSRFIITVGAAFDFHTDRLRQAPTGLQKVGLEWLFRLLMEPRRLFRRYAEIVPKFFVYSLIDLARFYFVEKAWK